MAIVFSVDEQAAFYYWLQIVARWDDSSAIDAKSLTYYTGQIHSVWSQEQRKALHDVKYILQHNANPRQLLAELYAGNIRSHDARTIAERALSCMPLFEAFVWRDAQLFEVTADMAELCKECNNYCPLNDLKNKDEVL